MTTYMLFSVLVAPWIKWIAKRQRLKDLETELEWLNYFLYTQSGQSSMSIRELHVAVNVEDLKASVCSLHDVIGRKMTLSDRALRNLVNCRTVCRKLMDDASAGGKDNVFKLLDTLQRPLVQLTEDHVTIR